MADVLPFPFATLDELKERWPDFPVGAEPHATVLLEDASQFILDMVPEAAEVTPATRRRVVCSVVRRAMEADEGAGGVESMTMAAGPYQQTFKPTNPNGDFYLTKAEKKALGEGRQKAFGVVVGTMHTVNHQPWCSLMFLANYCSCGADLTGDQPLWEY